MSENYDKTLELFKKLQEGGATDAAVQPRRSESAPTFSARSIEDIDEAVFGKYDPSEDTSSNNGDKLLLETMKEYANGEVSEDTRKRVEENIKNLKIPKAILQSMMSQPLIETKIGKDDIDEFMEKQAMKNANIQASNRIIQKVDEMDSARQQRKTQEQPRTADITENLLQAVRETVETTIEKKFSELNGKTKLNESSAKNVPSIRMIQEVDGGKFLLLDSDDNVYECTMVYKGKNKKR